MLGSTGMDIGRDALSTVVDDYEGPNPFTGTVEQVTVEVRSQPGPADWRPKRPPRWRANDGPALVLDPATAMRACTRSMTTRSPPWTSTR